MMGIPSFILDFFAALMLLVAAVSAGRLVLDCPGAVVSWTRTSTARTC